MEQGNVTDIVVVGGGIAGSGLAARLAAGGLAVEVLERTTEYPDRVRGEMYCPWGVAIAGELGLLQPLLDAGAAFSTNWVFYDDALPPDVAESVGVDTSAVLPGVPGILNITHPTACQALCDHATACGAVVHRGVEHIDVDLADGAPTVSWRVAAGTDPCPGGRRSSSGPTGGRRSSATPPASSCTARRCASTSPGCWSRRRTGCCRRHRQLRHAARRQLVQLPAGSAPQPGVPGPLRRAPLPGAGGLARFMDDLRGCGLAQRRGAGRRVERLTPLATHPSVDTWTDEPCAPGCGAGRRRRRVQRPDRRTGAVAEHGRRARRRPRSSSRAAAPRPTSPPTRRHEPTVTPSSARPARRWPS